MSARASPGAKNSKGQNLKNLGWCEVLATSQTIQERQPQSPPRLCSPKRYLEPEEMPPNTSGAPISSPHRHTLIQSLSFSLSLQGIKATRRLAGRCSFLPQLP